MHCAKCSAGTWAYQNYTVFVCLCVQMYFVFTRRAVHKTHSSASVGRHMFCSQVGGWKVVRWVHGWTDAGDKGVDGQRVRPELCAQTPCACRAPEISVLPGLSLLLCPFHRPIRLHSRNMSLKEKIINDFMVLTADELRGVGPVRLGTLHVRGTGPSRRRN